MTGDEVAKTLGRMVNGLESSTGALGPAGLALQSLGINFKNANG